MRLVRLPTWMVDCYGINVGKYTSLMDPMGCVFTHHLYLFEIIIFPEFVVYKVGDQEWDYTKSICGSQPRPKQLGVQSVGLV